VPRVLHDLGQRLDLLQLVLAGTLDQAFDSQRPTVEIDFRIEDVVVVVGKAIEGRDFAVAVGWLQPVTSEQLGRSPVAESEAIHQQRLLQLGNSKCADGDYWDQLQELAAIDTSMLARSHVAHFFACGTRAS
jgi:hypothetical protein